MKTTQKYYFSVEGETEKWYFNWLQDKINNEETAKYDFALQQYKGYRYYRENPSLSIWESVEKIMIDCGLM